MQNVFQILDSCFFTLCRSWKVCNFISSYLNTVCMDFELFSLCFLCLFYFGVYLSSYLKDHNNQIPQKTSNEMSKNVMPVDNNRKDWKSLPQLFFNTYFSRLSCLESILSIFTVNDVTVGSSTAEEFWFFWFPLFDFGYLAAIKINKIQLSKMNGSLWVSYQVKRVELSNCRAYVSVDAVGAAAPRLFSEKLFCTDRNTLKDVKI